MLNFERFAWGGVRGDYLPYVVLELVARSLASDRRTKRSQSVGLFSRRAQAHIEPPLLGNCRRSSSSSAEILTSEAAVPEILAVCGVLTAPQNSGFDETYVNAADRELAPGHWMETACPACWWRWEDGVTRAAVSHVLPLLS